jgi:hypothetical protein
LLQGYKYLEVQMRAMQAISLIHTMLASMLVS